MMERPLLYVFKSVHHTQHVGAGSLPRCSVQTVEHDVQGS